MEPNKNRGESPALSKRRALERIFVFQAVEDGQLTVEQLSECIQVQEERKGGNLLTVCKEKGYLSSAQVNHLMSKRLDANAARAVGDFLNPREKQPQTIVREAPEIDESLDSSTIVTRTREEERKNYERLLAEKDRLLEREHKQIEFLRKKLDSSILELQNYEKEKQKLLNKKQQEIETLESELTCYKGLHEQSEKSIQALRKDYDEKCQLLQKEKNKSKGLLNLMEESGRELTESEESRRKAEAELERERKEKDYIQGRLEKENQEKSEWKKKFQAIQEEKLKLEKSLQQYEDSQSSFQQTRQELWENLERVEKEKLEAEENYRQLQAKTEELEGLVKELNQKLTAQKRQTQSMEVQLRQSSSTNKAKKEEIPPELVKELREQEQKLQEELKQLREKIATTQEEKKQLEDKLAVQNKELSEQLAQIKQEKEELVEQFRKEKNGLEDEFEKTKSQMEENFHRQKIELETNLSQYRQKSEDLEAKLQQYQDSLKGWGELEEQVEQEKEKARSLENEKQELEQKLGEVERQVQVFQQVYQEGEMETGTVLLGSGGEHYTVRQVLGRGGMGITYSAVRASDEKTIVIKTLQPAAMSDMKELMRFVQEARTILSFEHENLVQGYDFYQGRELCYFAMEFLEGESVEDILEMQGLMDVVEATKIILGVSRALAYLEEKNLVHRDVKPSNILLTSSNLPKLLDFGIVKMTDRTCSLTTEGIILGTPYYLSPEQMYQSNVDIRSDIYSLGATYYHMVVGDVPFSGDNPIDVIQKRLKEVPKPGKVNPKLPKHVCNIIEKMMRKKPQKRPNSAAELVRDMETVLKKIS